jgi:hypothetical protein
MKRTILACIAIFSLAAMGHGFTYKNNAQTGEPDLVTTSVTDLTDIATAYTAYPVFKAYTSIDRVTATTLAAWPGSTNITTLGTITTGTVPVARVTGLAASATTDTTNASNISSGTLASARGGAGTVSGILKANGSGVVSAAVAGTDYADSTQPAWTAATLINSWSNVGGGFGTAAYMRDTVGNVHLRGFVGPGASVVIMTLPVGYRPLDNSRYFPVVYDTGAAGFVFVDTSGNVTSDNIVRPRFLDSITFQP